MFLTDNVRNFVTLVYAFVHNEACFSSPNPTDAWSVTFTNNTQLLQRARNDITAGFPSVDPTAVTPTLLIIIQFNDITFTTSSAQV